MSFVLIKGNFKPLVGTPDGDSMRFLAKNMALWAKLEGAPVKPSTSAEGKDTVQLRLEGIDAIEKAAVKPLAKDATLNMLKQIKFDKETNPEPAGYILSRMTDDKSRRPICFVFAGSTPDSDGADVFLNATKLRTSVNYGQMRDGFAYPLYYNTLFAALRAEFTKANHLARNAKRGYWQSPKPHDATATGVSPKSEADIALMAPIWPKLWRRLQEYFKTGEGSLTNFVDFLAAKNERLDLLDIMEERGLQDIVSVKQGKLRLLTAPENIRIVGKAGARKR